MHIDDTDPWGTAPSVIHGFDGSTLAESQAMTMRTPAMSLAGSPPLVYLQAAKGGALIAHSATGTMAVEGHRSHSWQGHHQCILRVDGRHAVIVLAPG